MIRIIESNEYKPDNDNCFAIDSKISLAVQKIIKQVIDEGDKALKALTEKFDKVKLEKIRVLESTIKQSENLINNNDKKVIEKAIDNIRQFHNKQKAITWVDKFNDGSELGQIVSPIDRAGIYIPGGRAIYPSTLLMNAIPAQIAGVKSIAVVSPPLLDGNIHPMILGTCSLLKLYEVYSVGGAQSIAALAFGTESINSVCKITGPGNAYVAEAKRQVFGKVGIDSIAGPSEILILHDDPEVPVEYIVRDMLSQAEHDPDAKSILITTLKDYAHEVKDCLNKIVPEIPRNEIIKQSIMINGMIIVIKDLDEGVKIVNQIAPEHFELCVKDESIASKIRNAGAIFVGKWTPEPVGDYFAGPNHILPTNSSARYSSALGVYDFQKFTSLIKYSKQRLFNQAKDISHFAEMEELFAHSEAIKIRLR